MLKKLLAGLTAIALSLGMVALTAGPASAHSNNISAQVACNTTADGFWKVTWTISNDHGADATINSSNRAVPPVGTVIPANSSKQFVEYFTTKPTSNVTLTINSTWAGDNFTRDNDKTVNKNDFKDDCLPDTTDHKVWICHANNGQGTGGFVKQEVDIDSIIKSNGHAEHQNGRDIIPPFTYIKKGVDGSFPGLNWNPPYSQAFLDAGCSEPTATPAVPTFTEAQCTATAGVLGQASYVIPTTTGIKYTVQINGAGGFADKAAGTYYVSAGTKVEVQAVALSGYKLGSPNYWSITFATKDCTVTVTPNPVTFSVLECVDGKATQPSYTIPVTTGVAYEVRTKVGAGAWSGWIPTSAGTYNVGQNTLVEARAVQLTGYLLSGTTTWNTSFGTVDCRVTPAAPGFEAAECTGEPGAYGPASYTIPATTGVEYQVKIGSGPWTVTPAGTYDVDAGAFVQVKAVGVGDYVLKGTKQWTKNFTAPDCDVKVVPVEPTWTEAVCTAEHQVGTASYYLPEIEGVTYQLQTGLFTFTPIAAGQHDVVDGSIVGIRALPAPGYEFPGADLRYWVHAFTNFDLSKDCIVPDAPTFDPQECTDPGDASQATFTVPAEQGVKYQLWDGDSWETIDAGTYDVTSFPTTVKIRALPKPGHEFLDNSVTTWKYDFTSAGDCLDPIAVEPVVASNQLCVEDDPDTGAYHFDSGTITIPNTPHVTYSVNGVVTGAGPHDFAPGVYTISAEAEAGYKLTGVPDPWTVEILADLPCGLPTFPVVTPTVDFSQTTCSAAGTYTLAAAPAELAEGIIWTVSGGLSNTIGTHAVNTAGTVTIKAVPAPGYGFGDGQPGAFREWSYDFASLPDDCLPTLALTGSSIATGGLGLAGLLTLGGILLIRAHRRRAALIEE